MTRHVDGEGLLPHLEEIVLAAGRILLSHHGALDSNEIDFKGKRDLQTRADRESEAFILGEVRRRFPDHGVLAEESYGGGGETLLASGRPLWIIDPLDGTTNFVQALPLYSISIGVHDSSGPMAAAIHVPSLNETYLAARGVGATCNGRKIGVSTTAGLIDSVLATGFAYLLEDQEDSNLEHFCRLIPLTRAIRRCGSAALDLAWTAAGRFDGFWELHLSPWDVAAGGLIVREAGGVTTDRFGGESWLFGRSIVAGNPNIHARLLDAIA